MVKILFATMARFDPGMAHQAMQTNARFCEGLPLLYYSHTTFQNNHISPQHDENNSRRPNGRRLFLYIKIVYGELLFLLELIMRNYCISNSDNTDYECSIGKQWYMQYCP